MITKIISLKIAEEIAHKRLYKYFHSTVLIYSLPDLHGIVNINLVWGLSPADNQNKKGE